MENNTPYFATGIDVVAVERVKKLTERTLDKILTEAERTYCESAKNRDERVAGRFAVKEAVMKALGTGWGEGVRWTDIEVLPGSKGAPMATLRGAAADKLKELGCQSVQVSISHDGNVAVASAFIFGLRV